MNWLFARSFFLLLFATNLAFAKPQVLAPPIQANALVKLAKQVEPDLVGRVERLPQYLEFFRAKLGNDTRLFAFRVEAVPNKADQVRLKGYVEFPQTRGGLVGFLEALGFDVVDDGLVMLPEVGLG